jgi:hypothetical protein
MRCKVNMARTVKKRKAYRIFVAESEGRRQLGRSWGTWEDNISMDSKEIG